MSTVGCVGSSGPETAHVGGKVTLDGQPLPSDATGTVVIRPAEPERAGAASVKIVNGRYDCPEAPVGDVKVFIDVQLPTGKMLEGRLGPYPEYESVVAPENTKAIDLEITGDLPDQDFDVKSG